MNAFIDPTTRVLKCFGMVEFNEPGDVKIPVDRDFSLQVGKWAWNGSTWVAFVPPPPPPSSLAQALDAALSGLQPTLPQIKAVFQAWRQQVS